MAEGQRDVCRNKLLIQRLFRFSKLLQTWHLHDFKVFMLSESWNIYKGNERTRFNTRRSARLLLTVACKVITGGTKWPPYEKRVMLQNCKGGVNLIRVSPMTTFMYCFQARRCLHYRLYITEGNNNAASGQILQLQLMWELLKDYTWQHEAVYFFPCRKQNTFILIIFTGVRVLHPVYLLHIDLQHTFHVTRTLILDVEIGSRFSSICFRR